MGALPAKKEERDIKIGCVFYFLNFLEWQCKIISNFLVKLLALVASNFVEEYSRRLKLDGLIFDSIDETSATWL